MKNKKIKKAKVKKTAPFDSEPIISKITTNLDLPLVLK